MVRLRRKPLTDQEKVLRELKLRRRQAKWAGGTDPIILTRKQFRSLRPARNVILQGLWLCLLFVSINQLVGGVSPDSVNATQQLLVQQALSCFIIATASLMMVGAWFPRDGVALASEIVGAILGVGGFAVYALIIAADNERFWATAGFAWATALFGGCLCRGIQILRRGY